MEATSGEQTGTAVTGPPEPAVLDYGALPPAVAVLVLVLAGLALVGAALLARFLDKAVLQQAWTERDLPCENALYLLFSVAVADLLQAGCVLMRGLQLLMAHWFLSRPLCRLWSLLDAVAGTARLLFLLAINGRLLREGHWPRPLKTWLISLIWLLVIAGSYLAVQPIGVRHDRTCGQRHAEHVPAAALWQYVVDDATGLALLPVAVGVYLWYRGRPPGGAASAAANRLDQVPASSEEVDGPEGTSADNALTSGHEEAQAATTRAVASANSDTEVVGAAAAPASPMPYAQRVRKLERCDTYTPSTFTLKNFWGMPSVDELSSASGFTELGESDGEGEGQEEGHRHRKLTLHQVTEVRRRVHLFVLRLSLAHFSFSLAAFVVHVLIDLQLTEEDPWQTAAVALDIVGQLQPLTSVLIFGCMFPRFYRMLFK